MKKLSIKQIKKLKEYKVNKYTDLLIYGCFTMSKEELKTILFPPKPFSYLNTKIKSNEL